LWAEYQKADILFVHLNDFEALRKVLPSKLFEYAATGKPIWAGVSGYAAKFIDASIDNAVVFEPCNVDEAIRTLKELNLVSIERAEFIENFSEITVLGKMAADILTLLTNEGRL
jgi:glycosyltransferase involved in cell wall biosynthesis